MRQSLRIDEVAPGACGLLIDEMPMLLASNVKPYVIAILLHRGAVRRHEIQASLVSHCSISDLKVGEWDSLNDDYCETTRLEELIDEVLGDFVSEGILRYSEARDMWVLTGSNISTIISWAAATGAKLPHHLIMELTHKQQSRVPGYVKPDYANN